MFLATANGAEREVFLTVHVIAFAFTGARDETIRMVRIYRQREEGKTLPGAGKRLEFLPGFVQYRIVIETPVVAVGRVGNRRL